MSLHYSLFSSRSILKRTQRAAQALISLLAVNAFFIHASETAGDRKLELRLVHLAEWNADLDDAKAVLLSAAGELWKYFPERRLPRIEIQPKGGPITLFKRGADGEIRVKLDTGGRLWAQYSFQFSHEFCHILCDFKEHENPNHWFEESLCEMASVFALRRMSETWKTKAPYPNWKDYAQHLRTYADERSALARIPDGKAFLQWFAENEADMRLNPTDRTRNNIVAGVVLPLFEAQPEMWEAVSYLNTEKLTKLYSFKQYLEAWRKNSQEKHRAFIDKIGRQFGMELKK
jgi:hypothetical protein